MSCPPRSLGRSFPWEHRAQAILCRRSRHFALVSLLVRAVSNKPMPFSHPFLAPHLPSQAVGSWECMWVCTHINRGPSAHLFFSTCAITSPPKPQTPWDNTGTAGLEEGAFSISLHSSAMLHLKTWCLLWVKESTHWQQSECHSAGFTPFNIES